MLFKKMLYCLKRGDIAFHERDPGAKSGRRPLIEHEHLVAALEELFDDVEADEARAAGDQDHFLKPRIPEAEERGSRGAARPWSTSMKNSKRARLNASGSSMLMVWPERGSTTRPEFAMLRFMSSAGSRQGSSSSPVTISVGTAIFFMSSTSSYSDGRRIWTPRMVSAWPFAECSPSCCAN